MTLLGRLFGAPQPGAAEARTGLEAVDRVLLPRSCAEATQAHLRAAGRTGNEGLAIWSGIQEGSTFRILTVTTPRQQAIRSDDGVCVVLDGDALHALNVKLHKAGERLFAQIHSHPGRAYHSPMDDQFAVVTAVGGLSVVVPDFAVRPFSVGDCAIYRLTRSGKWAEVPKRRAEALIGVVGDIST